MSGDREGSRGGTSEAGGDTAWRRVPVTLALILVIAAVLVAPGCRPSTRGGGGMGALVAVETATAEDVCTEAVNPLDGEVVEDQGLLRRRVLAVKVENDPAARPQSGVADAEVVIEEMVEGGITRFICLYLAHESPVIGPTRSVRPTDMDVLHFLQPLLAFSGGAPQVMEMVKSSGIMYVTEDSPCFWRDRKRPVPHNLYTSTSRLREYLQERGDQSEGIAASGLDFREPAGDASTQEEGIARMIIPAGTVDIPYESGCAVRYRYDPARDAYLRFVQGKPHTDKESGQQLAPRNVVLQFVQLTSSGVRDVLGAESPNSMVIGSGRCAVFTGGEIIVGTWVKNGRDEPTRYYDLAGQEIGLNPGQTWVHLVPNNLETTFLP